ncbi:MAG: DUF1467 family protein [Rhodothalassiaceae bacterium]
MGWVTGILVYAVLWWLVFMMALPVGVRAQNESEDGVVLGTPESAPVKPHIWRKAAATTLIAGALWGLLYKLITGGYLALLAD